MKKKIIVFGTGESAKKLLKAIKYKNAKIIAFADNNYNKHGKIFENKMIINPRQISEMRFDYIIISNIKYEKITRQLVENGIDDKKIFSYFNEKLIDNRDYKKIVDRCIVIRDIYDYKILQMTIKINNMPYEIGGEAIRNNIVVKNIEQTMKCLLTTNVSISRFGDGEMKLIAGKDIGFQKYSASLARRLQEVLVSCDMQNHIVGILNVYGDLSMYTDEIQAYFRQYLFEYNREFQFSVMNKQKVYYDAFITRPYISYKNREHTKTIFDQFKSLWDKKKILIVEGDRTRLGIGNDLFKNAEEIKRIICPNENAYEKYDQIIEKIRLHCDKRLVLLALGPAATILAYDLAKSDIRALDIGHIDLEYEWYLMGAEEKVVVKNKYTNEVFGGNAKSLVTDKEYEQQIIDIVK